MVGKMLEKTSENTTFLFEICDLKHKNSQIKLVAKISAESENIAKEVSTLLDIRKISKSKNDESDLIPKLTEFGMIIITDNDEEDGDLYGYYIM